MQSLWPWLAVAAAGALHGMNPATGWAVLAWSGRAATVTLAQAGAQRGGKPKLLRSLLPIAAGHALAVLVVAAAVPLGLQLGVAFDPLLAQWIAAGLLLALAGHHLWAREHAVHWPAAAPAGLALWSFIVGTAHGAGWMLVPALVPLCGGDLPGREITASGSLGLALAAVGLHLGAMLATSVVMAAGVLRGWRAWARA